MRGSLLWLSSTYTDIEIDTPEVIDEFARRFPRRMKVANIIQDR